MDLESELEIATLKAQNAQLRLQLLEAQQVVIQLTAPQAQRDLEAAKQHYERAKAAKEAADKALAEAKEPTS